MIDVEGIIRQRLDALRSDDPDIDVEYDIIEDGDWGFITILDDELEPMAFEFVESQLSWKRGEAVEEYNNLAGDGFDVAVIAPDETFLDLNALLASKGDPNIGLFSYSSLGIRPIPLAS